LWKTVLLHPNDNVQVIKLSDFSELVKTEGVFNLLHPNDNVQVIKLSDFSELVKMEGIFNQCEPERR
jgi:hypothetical protein